MEVRKKQDSNTRIPVTRLTGLLGLDHTGYISLPSKL